MMNLKEIRDDVRSLIIEPTPGFRSNKELNNWINQAHQELGMLYRIEATKDYEILKNVEFHNLPSDLLTFKGAWDSGRKSIPIIPVASGRELARKQQEPGDNTDDNDMTIFTYGNTFVLVPPPKEKTNIKIFYERYPAQLIADDNVPEIPLPYHRYLVSYGVMRALQKDEDFEGASIYENEYNAALQIISTHKSPISQDAQTILDVVQTGILNPAEAAQWLNLPMKDKVWQRVEVENKALRLLESGVISKDDLIERTVFPDKAEIEERLAQTASDLIPLPNWEDDING